MTRLRVLLARLLGLFSRDVARDRKLRAEIDAHIAEAAEEFERQGVPADKARRLAFGLAGALLATPVLQSQLINLPANDPATFTGVSVLLIAIALVASYVPARRATRINPIATLRAE
jgi:hypothetical protein